jgi:hypothetical protein
MEPRRALGVGCAAAALLVTGCGTGDRAADVRSMAERFQHALEQPDADGACRQLSASTISALERQETKPCPDAVLSLDLLRGGEVEHVDVS